MSKQLSRLVIEQVATFQKHGARTTLRHSKQVRNDALALWRSNHTQANQQLWRLATLAHGAIVALAGSWDQARLYYETNPDQVLFESTRYPHPETTHNIKLAGLMHINLAVAHIRYGGPSALQAPAVAERGLAYLAEIEDPWVARWHGIALAAKAYGQHALGGKATAAAYAEQALRYTTEAQPELRKLLTALSSGRKSKHIKPDGFQPSECLYYFNG